MENIIKIGGSALITFLTFIMGGWDQLAQVLIVLMIIDYVTGVIRSAKCGGLSSEVGFIGILKKVLILIMVGVGVCIDFAVNLNGIARALVISYYIANEALSIIENIGEMGIPVPAKLKQMIEKLRSDNDEDNTSGDSAN